MARDLIDLHIHVGGAVAPHILWSIAHQQGFKLPVKNYFEFVELITARPGKVQQPRGLPEDHAHLDGEDSELADGDRALGLRGDRQGVPRQPGDADRAALQPDEAQPELRARPRPHHPRRAAGHGPRDARVRREGRASSSAWRASSTTGSTASSSRRPSSTAPAAWSASTSPAPRRTRSSCKPEVVAQYEDLFERARKAGLKTTVHTGETARHRRRGRHRGGREAQAAPHRPRHPRGLRRGGDEAAPERDVVLELCPTSNLHTKAVEGIDELKHIVRPSGTGG